MTPTSKKILALGLVVLVGVVWVPQILSANAKREPNRGREISALGEEEARVPDKSAPTPGIVARERTGANADRGDLAHALETSIARARLVAPELSHVELAPKTDPIDAFLAAHPLRGTLIGPTQQLAYLGPLLVAVGDEPVPGLVVGAIEARGVTFTRDGALVRVDLIPFQARAPIAVATTSSASSDGVTDSSRQVLESRRSEMGLDGVYVKQP